MSLSVGLLLLDGRRTLRPVSTALESMIWRKRFVMDDTIWHESHQRLEGLNRRISTCIQSSRVSGCLLNSLRMNMTRRSYKALGTKVFAGKDSRPSCNGWEMNQVHKYILDPIFLSFSRWGYCSCPYIIFSANVISMTLLPYQMINLYHGEKTSR